MEVPEASPAPAAKKTSARAAMAPLAAGRVEDKKDKKAKRGRKSRRSNRRRRRSSSREMSDEASYSDSSSSHSANAVFREATRTRLRSSQENLIRFARNHPGRLACAAMQSWDQQSAKTGKVHKYEKRSMPACAKRYFLNTLKPKEGEKITGRMREIEVLSHVMDALATNQIPEAADIIVQRMAACKMADEDGTWVRAQYAELIPPNSINMVSREMRQMTVREEATQKRLGNVTDKDEEAERKNPQANKGKGYEEPWIIKKGGKTYKKGWILQGNGKGGRPWGKNDGYQSNNNNNNNWNNNQGKKNWQENNGKGRKRT